MQGTAWFVSAAGFALAMSATPGPNNALVAAAAANFGIRRSLPQMLGVAIGFPVMLVLVALVQGYAFAWVGHFFFEHNKPATFKYPLFSLMGDWRMWYDILKGKMKL